MTDEHRRLRDQVHEFAREEIAPRVARMERAGTHAERDLAALMGTLGWIGVLVPREYGGMGAGHVAKTILIEHTAYVSGAAGAILQASLIPALALQYLGTPEQQDEWLPQIADGLWSTIAVTEPEHGSDVLGMTSSARRNQDGSWVLNGHKTFIGNSDIAGLHLVIARTGEVGSTERASAVEPDRSRGRRSLSAFLVEADRRGVCVEPQPFTGLHGFSAGDLRLREVHVPAANLLGGEEGTGLVAAYGASVVCGRLNLAALALGLHQRLRDETVAFVTKRPRKGGYLSDKPVVRRRLAEIESALMNSELAIYHSSALLDSGVPCDPALINAKLTAKRAAALAAQEAADLFGGYAVRADYPFARLDRDIRHVAAPAGPDDVQLLRLGEEAAGVPREIQWSLLFTGDPKTAREVALSA
ncbi:acyl-CoA/acyl-ACP dehydrogenase [Streptomyces sp. Go40/10]|uniref:acyl-CoA dehydrogenase family protein n=1 Tax=Streptomyces sp. Go40/10 TaxID=2825844 RepID=UPI001E512780|nr:acyl-CoA dehydrogenase family protein [Streptomyces sp. Go40/10]UFQ99785.1 acyl-CoA/acyl-ACP dehydrogenase [Streptomyces sp. Go40/10]